MQIEQLRKPGVWYFTDGMTAPEAAAFAVRVEELGYSALWLPETTGRDPFAHIAFLATQTSTLVFATGIASIFHRHAGPMKQAAMTLAEQTGDRFVLGLGVSHQVMVEGVRKLDYSRPLSQMRDYLALMDESRYSAVASADPPPRLLAALGPKMLELAATAADGAHPYFSTPEHTAIARDVLGPDKFLCVEQKVVVTTDATAARAAATASVSGYASLPNYRNNWLRLGYTEDEIESRAERFLDAVVAWGDQSAVRARVDAHYDAGADHVCIQPLPTEGRGLDLHALEALAPG
ncbi:MAG: TIGR03620 family F420-dependent LLM class oxidoreductase [Acidimicrobiia bacterium]